MIALKNFVLSHGYYLTAAMFLVCTLAGVVLAARWRREVDEDLAPPSGRDVLDPLEQAYFSGLMRPDEIARVREAAERRKAGPGEAPVSAAKVIRPVRPPDLHDAEIDGVPGPPPGEAPPA